MGKRGLGSYNGGSFMRPNKRPKKSKYQDLGFKMETEAFGTHSQANCLWIGCSNYDYQAAAFDVGVGMIRYIMRRHYQIKYREITDRLWPVDYISADLGSSISANADGTRVPVILRFKNRTTGSSSEQNLYTKSFEFFPSAPATTVSNPSKSVADFAVWFRDEIAFNHEFKNQDRNPEKDQSVYSYNITERHQMVSSGNNSRVDFTIPDVYIDHMYIKIYQTATMLLQNVTAPDDGDASLLTTRLDANPIKGKLYHFDAPIPLLDHKGQFDDNRLWQVNPHGILKASAANINPATQDIPGMQTTTEEAALYRRQGQLVCPPKPNVFKNCTKYSKVAMAPGEIKGHTIKFTYDGKLTDWIQRHPQKDSDGGIVSVATQETKTWGTSWMVAMDKVMRTGENEIRVNYHVDRHHGAYVKKVKSPTMPKLFNIQEQADT